ncbi:phosphoglucosamine mutase [Acidothermus cellulolyticus 11B]|uniref:Phosphoglucosamine mutase n=1 Tax=Acidothermus cellulolyticus (strain ATCC 43068 / DSM 8971 / 11B) TaxID=351607 RepID=GLMM_ACIC1|nr:phosphoglucosamine mutase [Acidothermus cellulolyticus]A0LRQ7.1 RecName: Full=Phosphoglucosamine mutase [Acidothermus cellulolyticus 11B]ABK52117.1 phosphoglucosamine mutase [Acidothermus cellulolyticus 11B]
MAVSGTAAGTGLASTPRLFGTDGVRGIANRDLTAELALDLAVAAAHVLAQAGAFEGHRPLAVVGRDPRASGEFLEAAVVAGLASAGVDVLRLGVLPTPAVAYLTAALDADLGVVLSASHNPMPDNGIKFLARGGHKLPDDIEDAVAARLGEPWTRPVGRFVGRVRDYPEGLDQYVEHVLATSDQRLDGLRVVVDCAHGAASVVSPAVLRRAGATVVPIGCEPDGYNINDGHGSTNIETLQAAVRREGADAGIAHDGDADRCLAVDAAGDVVDGDQILAILALAWQEAGRLAHDTVVATVMSNLGLKLGLAAHGISVVETAVGDRYVLEAMRAGGYVLGGEQSGHIIMLDYATTGDGVLTGLQLLGRMAATGRPLADLARVVRRLPQVLRNVTGVDKTRVDTDPVINKELAAARGELGDGGRVLLRASGTEPVVRVMVEAETEADAERVAERLARVVRERLG